MKRKHLIGLSVFTVLGGFAVFLSSFTYGQSATTHIPAPVLSPQALADVDVRLKQLDQDLNRMRGRLLQINPEREMLQARSKVRGRMLYKMLRAGLLPISGGFQQLVTHAQKITYLKRSTLADINKQQQLASEAQSLSAKVQQLSQEQTQLTEKKMLLETAANALEQERRRQEAFERAFAASPQEALPTISGPSNHTDIVVYGPGGRDEIQDNASFRSKKGRLPFPVAGETEVRPSSKEDGPSIEIKAKRNAQVRAVHSGKVVFADRYGSYGSLVILDHGDRCFTVSSNLASLDVKVGDTLRSGAPIGRVGDDGRGPTLYFEVRIGNQKVNPVVWLGL